MSMATESRKSENGNRPASPQQSILCAMIDDGNFAVVRVIGRGCFNNSVALRDFLLRAERESPNHQPIIDLAECDAMDSTFMGLLAGSARTLMESGRRMILVNVSQHCFKLLKNLGVSQLVDIRKDVPQSVSDAEHALEPAAIKEASRTEQICLTLQAHKQLVDLDEQNEVRFQAVIEYLEKSLEEEC